MICAPRPSRLLPLAFGLFGIVGCMKPNPLVAELEAAEGQEAPEDEGIEDEGEGENPEDGQTEGEPTSGSEEEADTDPPQMPLDLGSEACSAPLSFSPSCGECLADACCDQVLACEDSADCLCLSDCVASGNSPGVCKNECGVKLQDVPSYQALAACSEQACAGSCPL